MKKHFAFLTATLLAVSLSACTTPTTSTGESASTSSTSVIESTSSEVTSSSETTSISSSESSTSSSISSSSSSASSSSVEGPKEVKIGEFYDSRTWDESIKNMTKTVLGDSWEKVPVFLATRYEAYMNFNDSGVLTFQIRCFGVNGNSATRLYKEKMVEYGYYFSAESNYGYQMVDYYSDLFLAYSYEELDVQTVGSSFFVIQANIQQTREAEWNNDAVSLYTDLDNVPACPAQSYQTSYDNSKDTLTVFALFVDKNTVVNKYMSELVKAGFTSKGTDQYGATTMVDSTGYLTVTLYLTYGDYDCDALYINFVNVWPSVGIVSFTNLTHFPKLVSDTARYDSYTYLNLGSEDKPDYRLCIYYTYASSTDYEGYVNDLVTYGFTKGNVEVSETNIISTYLSMFCTYQNGQSTGYLTINIRVLYQLSSNTVCLVIEEAVPFSLS